MLFDHFRERRRSYSHNALVQIECLLIIDDNAQVSADLVVVDADEGWAEALVGGLAEFVGVGHLHAHRLSHYFAGSHVSLFRLKPQRV